MNVWVLVHIFCKWKEVIQEGPSGAQNVKIELSYAHLDFLFPTLNIGKSFARHVSEIKLLNN